MRKIVSASLIVTLLLISNIRAITITKAGYKEWKRTITLNLASEITLEAALEKIPQE